ncbi:hypothetical protein NliqN6_1569 [Naganishia liquefaciens]|uniref:Uncharacterized protein n=1 Tax=Naganishia liquefaciens TaxID=104408 RepID=A0A8H3YEE7_9TREE|nr:hypothetical protein NliqN6_1569 [Naganishia liquefaciens]
MTGADDETPFTPPSTPPPTPVLAAEPDDGILSDILETFNEPYSPNNPGYSHNVDWMEFLDFELVLEDQPVPAFSNCVYAEPTVPNPIQLRPRMRGRWRPAMRQVRP